MFSLLVRRLIPNSADCHDPEVRRRCGMLSGLVGIALNLLLCAGKFLAGLLSGSIAITADAFNNLSDAGSSLITFFGCRLAGRKPDREHPFGYGRMETIAGFVVALLVVLMGLELGKSSVEKILHPDTVQSGPVVVGILLASILVKLYMFAYNRSYGKKMDSAAMRVTATDSLSDVASTSAVLASVLVSRLTGWNIDGWCGILVAAAVFWAGCGAAKDTISTLLGGPPDPALVKQIEDIVLSYGEIHGIHDLVVHDYGLGRLLVSLHAEVPADENVLTLHDAIDRAELELADKLGCEAVIHMDPIDTNDDAVNEKRRQLEDLIREIAPDVTIHDFRMVPGDTHTNLIFDAVVPPEFDRSADELHRDIEARVQDKWPECRCVIHMDRSYL